jgi:hypothetical protein
VIRRRPRSDLFSMSSKSTHIAQIPGQPAFEAISFKCGNIRKIQPFCPKASEPKSNFDYSPGSFLPVAARRQSLVWACNLWCVFMSVRRFIDFVRSLHWIGPRCSGGAR